MVEVVELSLIPLMLHPTSLSCVSFVVRMLGLAVSAVEQGAETTPFSVVSVMAEVFKS